MRILLLGIILTAVPGIVSAETALRVAESVTISPTQRVENNLYAAAAVINQTGTVVGDLYAAGNTIRVDGPVEEDVTLFAGAVNINTTVGGDVRLLAGDIQVAGEVQGDLFVIAGSLDVLPTATIVGDVYVFAGDATIAGPVTGSVFGRAERIRIDAPVGQDVDISSRQGLVLGSLANVTGDVRHQSTRTITRAPEAIVQGDIVENSVPLIEDDAGIVDRLLPALVMLFGSLVLYLLGRSFLAAVVTHALHNPVRAGLFGCAVYITGPILSVLLMVTVLGLIVGLGAFGATIVILALSYSVAPMIIGVIIWSLFGGKRELQPFAILVGVVTLQVLLLLPYIGSIVLLATSVIAAGAIVETMVRRLMHAR